MKRKAPASTSSETLESAPTFDVCVIGSGPAGCVVAEKLVAAGLNVVMLESGVGMSDAEGMRKAAALDAYENSGEIEYPLQATRFRGVGGTSNLWTGRCPRLLPSDFVGNPLAPQGGWPIRYEDLKPYYQQAEELLKVTGDTLTAGHAPRDRDLPYRLEGPYRLMEDITPLRSLLEPLNIAVDSPPTSKTGTVFRGPVRFASYTLPALTENENFTLVTDATATAIEGDGDGSVGRVVIKSVSGTARTIRAKKTIIACGGTETARLLLLSKSPQFAQGIGNHSGHLGRYFMDHPAVAYSAKMPGREFSQSCLGKTYQFCEMLNREGHGNAQLVFEMQKGSKLRIAVVIETSPEPSNRIRLSENKLDALGNPGADLHFSFSSRDRALFDRGEELVREVFGKLDSGPVKSSTEYLHWSHHHVGTTRMSDDPANGVVDANLRVHGTENLYVSSSSVFVTAGIANPTLTIVALSLRLADHLLGVRKGTEVAASGTRATGRAADQRSGVADES